MSSAIRKLLKAKTPNEPEVLDLNELPTWLDNHESILLNKFKREMRGILVELDKSISNMKIIAQKLASSSSDPETRGQERYIIQFAEKILSSLDEIQIPDVLTFDNIQAMYEQLIRALKAPSSMRQNKILRLHTSFKPLVKDFDSEFKKLHKISTKLTQVLNNIQPLDQQIKVIRKNIEKATKILEKPKQMREQLNKSEVQIKELNVQLEEVNMRFNKLQGKDDFKELEKIQTKMQELKTELSKFLDPFNKPLRKLSKSVSERKITLRSESMIVLNNFVKDPNYIILESNMMTNISLLLYDLKYLLEENKITIDKKKEKKVLDSIKTVQEGFLEKVRKEFEDLTQKEQLILSTSEASKFAETKKNLKVSKITIEKEINELSQSKIIFSRKISEVQVELEDLLHLIEEKIQTLFGINISIITK